MSSVCVCIKEDLTANTRDCESSSTATTVQLVNTSRSECPVWKLTVCFFPLFFRHVLMQMCCSVCKPEFYILCFSNINPVSFFASRVLELPFVQMYLICLSVSLFFFLSFQAEDPVT